MVALLLELAGRDPQCRVGCRHSVSGHLTDPRKEGALSWVACSSLLTAFGSRLLGKVYPESLLGFSLLTRPTGGGEATVKHGGVMGASDLQHTLLHVL